MRLDGYRVKFLTGTDEHGQKVDKAAKAKGRDPQAFTDEVSERFRHLVHSTNTPNGGENLLGVSNDDFIRTTENRHKKAAQALWHRLVDNGHVYKDTYGGWYAVRDEAYYQESELTTKDGKKIATASGAEVEWVEEESYFFDLSKWQEPLLDFYEKNPDFVTPAARYNEVRSFVKGGLKDLSISRTTFNWGVPVPGDDKHVMYVWIDALTNYLTAIGYPDTDSNEYQQFWSQGTTSPMHIVGKDILRFHAVYWPAFLMAAKLPLPRKIVAHGWWTIEGEKMSKSLGNVIAPSDLIAEFGLDPTRYFLMREVPFGNDGNFAKEAMALRINAELANNIGNLAQRSLSMIQKNCDGKVPSYSSTPDAQTLELLNQAKHALERIECILIKERMNFSEVLEIILTCAVKANEYIDQKAPWTLKKEGKTTEMGEVLYALAEAVRGIAILLQPFMPESSKKILLQLGYSESDFVNESLGIDFTQLSSNHALKPDTLLPAPTGVFPRIEVTHAG
jgi:methionyl-tRNA synthetase